MKNKRAVSGVVAVVLLIALVMVTGAIVWGVVNNLVKDYGSNLELGDSEWLVSRIAEFLQSQAWHNETHFIKTCREIVTHYTDYWKINVAVFKTAFIKANYTN